MESPRGSHEEELEALRAVLGEAKELLGAIDASGIAPAANVEALRALCFRADVRRGKRVRI
jgi:hypothetical protein